MVPPPLHFLNALLGLRQPTPRRGSADAALTPDAAQTLAPMCTAGEMAVLALGVENFHSLRSRLGASAMKTALEQVAQVIQLHLSPNERQGHNEEGIFLIQCPGRSASSAHLLANRICCAVAGQIMLGPEHRPVRLSAGLAQGPMELRKTLLTQAQTALQAARRSATGVRRGHHPSTD